MTQTDVFALEKTGLNPFLFAEVGIESNGSMLTVLSVFARLGQDPWAQAARWAKLPRPESIERLTNNITQMPLPPQAIRDARETASRLIQLLPTSVHTSDSSEAAKGVVPTLPRWPAVFLVAVMLGLSVAATLYFKSDKTDMFASKGIQIQTLSSSPPSPNVPSN